MKKETGTFIEDEDSKKTSIYEAFAAGAAGGCIAGFPLMLGIMGPNDPYFRFATFGSIIPTSIPPLVLAHRHVADKPKAALAGFLLGAAISSFGTYQLCTMGQIQDSNTSSYNFSVTSSNTIADKNQQQQPISPPSIGL